MLATIKIDNAEKIGTLSLDFRKNDSEAYNTIIIAGENGCGKTSILELIDGFMRGGFLHENSGIKETKYFDDEGIERCVRRDEEEKRDIPAEDNSPDDEWDDFGWKSEEDFIADFNDELRELREEMPYDIRNCGSVYSEARSGFEVTTDKNGIVEPREGEERYEKDGANYSGIVQLLMDLEEQDYEEFVRYSKSNPTCKYDEYMEKNSRITRFRRAFESMFENLTYVGRSSNSSYNSIYFKKDGKEIDIRELSTGEKQIVFRGVDLLSHSSKGATVCIDEPELSLHPKWQLKILGFYRNLFKDENGKQIAQLIIATHSPYIIKSALEGEDKDNIHLILLENNGNMTKPIQVEDRLLETNSSAEINYLVFGVDGREYHIQLFCELQNKLKKDSITSMDKYIKGHKLYDATKHSKYDTYKSNEYYTLPVYIRNTIDHPNSGRKFYDHDLDTSIKLLREIYRNVKTDDLPD